MENNISLFEKVKYKIQDRMLIGSVYDTAIKKIKYRESKLSFLYNVMIAQKHRMLYYKRLKNKYLKKCTEKREWEELPKENKSDTIWICWFQGVDNAPELVKTCIESVQKNLPEKKIVILHKDNIFEYIKIPDDIVEKWKNGTIGMAHFSDIIRLEILIKYGGYWIDSTVLCTDAGAIKYYDKLPLFMYSFYYFGFNPEIMETNNWFIKSCTNNNILCLMREFLYSYWRDHNRALDYFFFHIFMTIALEFYDEEYKKMPIVSQVDAHVLATYIYDDYDEEKYELLKLQTGFHKLSTRFEKEKSDKKDTFYQKIVKEKAF
ncbi:MAG: capsular polysaccharide synthesis protein [Lachnospiraceae bacterium]|nr:capsular polysaccharide synthesis protein [Lachnospiraceae bacterium]